MKQEKSLSPKNVYCIISLVCIVVLICAVFFSRGEYLVNFFFRDIRDTGMDFFHSIEYVKGRSPYILFDTLYPPLANLVFYVLLKIIPDSTIAVFPATFKQSIENRGTNADLRTYQSPFLIFIAFILITEIILMLFLFYILYKNGMTQSVIIAIMLVFSFGNLYAIERGNIIIVVVLLLLFYLVNYESNNKILRELAFVSLAFAAGLKLYPAIFGLLLLKNRRWFEALRCIAYGCVLTIAPLFFFYGGAYNNISIILRKIFRHTGVLSKSVQGIGIKSLYEQIPLVIKKIFDIKINFNNEMLKNILIIILAILMIGAFFFVKKKWQELLSLSATLIFSVNIGTYSLSLIILPFLYFIIEEKELNKHNVLPFLCMLLLILPITFPEWHIKIICWQIALITIFIWCIAIAIKEIRKNLIKNIYYEKQ